MLWFGCAHETKLIIWCKTYALYRILFPIELVLYHAIHVMLISTILLSVNLSIARYALFLKYRGIGDPSIRAVQSKAPYSLSRI